ncbi:PREDICTED: ATP-dependent DNA helicase PIF1-like [Lupinus angustifolius]|uniref:ATP-dependent DNA helicase PIF1-like n=1 Tax=Lupinus angustifolius TaxID=3871 RepID=UPI00092F94E7|nr:PREDICTED: ATP-dependent DNA helicase PIF1-like [Lupinus angustifolius]
MQVVNCQEGRMFFLYGYGGTRKTHMWRTLTYALRSQKHIVLTVASSGIASLLLPRGRTTHSKFKIPIPTFDNSVYNIHHGTELVELLKQTKLIIWDEAPMAHKFCFEALDKSLCDFMGTKNGSILFGGKVVVFGGDFRQILPVVPRGCRSDIVHATINASYLWHQCTVLTLTKNMCLQNHDNESDIKQFSEWILKMGNGKLSEPNDGSAEIDIPEELLIVDYDNPIDAIVSRTYPNLQEHYKDEQFLQCDEKEYLSSDEVVMSDANDNEAFNILTPEFLNSFSTSGLPNQVIKLKVGTPIMLLRNLDQPEGLCNGTRLVVTKMANHVLEAKIMSGKNIGNITYIPKLSMSQSQSPWPFMLIRRQFPIIVSYAMTMNKSQGQSLESVGLYLPRPVFSHGQLYISVSRVQSKKGLKILIHDKDGKPLKTTTNVVYKEVFQNL